MHNLISARSSPIHSGFALAHFIADNLCKNVRRSAEADPAGGAQAGHQVHVVRGFPLHVPLVQAVFKPAVVRDLRRPSFFDGRPEIRDHWAVCHEGNPGHDLVHLVRDVLLVQAHGLPRPRAFRDGLAGLRVDDDDCRLHHLVHLVHELVLRHYEPDVPGILREQLVLRVARKLHVVGDHRAVTRHKLLLDELRPAGLSRDQMQLDAILQQGGSLLDQLADLLTARGSPDPAEVVSQL
mmetsp:Transcript_22335/g.43449  ORF Transcript_22335/g.43449 Transcript_22335/m.43449 type:complete len:238 (+) Transcript_22335:203-916(+)